MSLQTSPTSPAVMSQSTKDAQFLLEIFRESPNPIHINIGPYAAKTGAKPNTIIKRLAGIKQRNRLNIKTTQGEYRATTAAPDGPRRAKAAKLKAEPPSPPGSMDTKVWMPPQFKAESPPSMVYGGGAIGTVFCGKVEPQPQPQCPLTPVSSRTHSVFGVDDAGAVSGSPASSFTPAAEHDMTPRPEQVGVKRQQREWDGEYFL